MKPTLHHNAAIGTFLLHAGLVAAIAAAVSGGHEPPASNPPLKVELLKPAPPVLMPVAQVPPASSPQPQPPQPKRRQRSQPAITAEAKHASPARETPPPKLPIPETSSDSRTAPIAPAAPAPPTSTALAPPAPLKTAPTDAAYAASNRKPPYPRVSKANQDEGTTVLRVLVKADGSAGEVQVKRSSGFPLLDESARSTVETWRFTPATVDGKPVAEWYQVDVPFKLLNN